MNNIFLLGRLTSDPETTATTSELVVSTFSIAVDRPKNKAGATVTDYIKIVSYGKTAEFIAKYIKKGVRVLVNGRMQCDTWVDRNERKHYNWYVLCNQIHFADGKKESKDNYVQVSNTEDGLPFH